jgi:catechol 2,3-dioxygenase-like lactoylglutathione lyase family enzyme
MLNGPNFVIRNVGDLDKTRRFYTAALGFRVEGEQPGFVQFATTGGATFALMENPDGGDLVVRRRRRRDARRVARPRRGDRPPAQGRAVRSPAGDQGRRGADAVPLAAAGAVVVGTGTGAGAR